MVQRRRIVCLWRLSANHDNLAQSDFTIPTFTLLRQLCSRAAEMCENGFEKYAH
jgi:hypothetical protein